MLSAQFGSVQIVTVFFLYPSLFFFDPVTVKGDVAVIVLAMPCLNFVAVNNGRKAMFKLDDRHVFVPHLAVDDKLVDVPSAAITDVVLPFLRL